MTNPPITKPKKVSLKQFRQRGTSWRTVHSGTIEHGDDNDKSEILFHWLTPGGDDLSSLADLSDDQRKTSDTYRAAGTFLASVLCNANGQLEFPDGYDELYDSGYGLPEVAEGYMQMFGVIIKAAESAKKKPPKIK